ncbi:hypothetical protein H3V53_39140 [Paraburkholderia bengalensis]|uniref:Uncharacterized protein n=1 Tax=Paraburkholderia bengalensis TaxID=2747562 RepID=A0ABU8J5I0_9BURK
MNVLIIHTTGSVGKSTLAAVLLRPRLGAELLSIENSNFGAERYGEPVRLFEAQDYLAYIEQLMMAEGTNTITDVGSSNFTEFVHQMLIVGGLSLFDYVIVPCEKQDRTQLETITTIQTLLNAGLDPSRLRVILNKVSIPTPRRPIDVDFAALFAEAEKDPRIQINPNCYVPTLPLFAHMAANGLTWQNILADKTDYRALVRESKGQGNTMERIEYVTKQLAQGMAAQTIAILDRAFEELDIGPAVITDEAIVVDME